ncbi:hypothetical protein [Pseudomonas fluorescens]|uniref:hypothetical protein n=1 Tax=Pseudomonas fluorescens TaxID=294 RepID=UPI000F84E255|nr:hypothetical protein [Pseudomonas fluorescens]
MVSTRGSLADAVFFVVCAPARQAVTPECFHGPILPRLLKRFDFDDLSVALTVCSERAPA